ncbi:MAG: GNAT family N-acetyltransferase [Defluviitaleaceae bacterium]|nr:GNAT family N-acetyltransferase [Defluviitaleaceae bacterium]
MHIPNIETERLILRRIHVDDYTAFAEYYGSPEIYESLFGHTDIDAKDIAAAFDFNLRLEICFSIVIKSTNDIIGNIHFVNITEQYLADIGYILHPDYWGQGFMTEALQVAISFAFKDYGLSKIRAVTEIINTHSIRLLERLEFMHEATLCEAAYGGRMADIGYFYLNADSDEKTQQKLFAGLNRNLSLVGLQGYISQILELRGLNGQPIQNSLLLLTEEVGELAKAIRKNTKGMSIGADAKGSFAVAEEIADILIVLSEIANAMNINLVDALIAKEKVNANRKWVISGGDES